MKTIDADKMFDAINKAIKFHTYCQNNVNRPEDAVLAVLHEIKTAIEKSMVEQEAH